jgi:hypothetical protein
VTMNAFALRFLGIVLTIAILSLVFSWFFKRELVQGVKQAITWLLKVSFFDFVLLIIFLKPLKKYSGQIGILIWLILIFVIGRYLIITQPKITEIPGPYIPMIGYVYYLSVLFIVHFVLLVSRKAD